jgi:hypothetical protein
MIDALSSDRLIGYIPILLPLLIALSGWLTLRLAQWASVWPRRFIGLPPYLGWQGYLFSHLELYVTHWSRGLLEKLGTLDQIFEHVGPEKIISHQLSRLRPQVDSFIDEVMTSRNQVLWENLPILVKNRFYARAHRMLPRIIDDIVEDLGDSLRRIVTYPQLLYFAEQDAPGTLVRFYDLLTRRAFERLARFCALAGFLGGLAQCVAGWLLKTSDPLFWTLTGASIGVGFFWLAQRRASTPVVPTVFGPFTLRSTLNRLRPRMNRELAEFLSQTVLSPRNIARTLVLGGRARHAHIIIKKRIAPLVEELDVRTFAQLTVGPIGYVNLKQSMADKLAESFLDPFEDERFNQERAKALAEFLHHRIENLPDQLFYQQMKWTLEPLAILGTCAGIALGAAAGGLQWLLLYF